MGMAEILRIGIIGGPLPAAIAIVPKGWTFRVLSRNYFQVRPTIVQECLGEMGLVCRLELIREGLTIFVQLFLSSADPRCPLAAALDRG
jgi:hypothetical protein